MPEERAGRGAPGFPIPTTDAREARRTSDGGMNRRQQSLRSFFLQAALWRHCSIEAETPRRTPMTEPAEPGGAGDKVMA